jgi:hypothetical protein
MTEPKLVWPHFQEAASFAIDRSNALLNNKCFFVPKDEAFLLALLNSRCSWFQLTSMARVKRGGYIEAEAQYVERLSMPVLTSKMCTALTNLSDQCTAASARQLEIQWSVRHRILDLAPPERQQLSTRLVNWWNLDFKKFHAEVKRALRADIPVKERNEWEAYLATNAEQCRRLTSEIEVAEQQIDTIVYRLFDMTADDIELLEHSLPARG